MNKWTNSVNIRSGKSSARVSVVKCMTNNESITYYGHNKKRARTLQAYIDGSLCTNRDDGSQVAKENDDPPVVEMDCDDSDDSHDENDSDSGDDSSISD